MPITWCTWSTSSLGGARRRIFPGKTPGAGGFSLVEIMVVVVIAGILATFAIQEIRKIEINARSSRVANDLRIFANGFTAYAQQYGTLPPTALPGAIPTGMAPYLRSTDWTSPSSIGGYFFWINNITFGGTHYNGCILIFTYNGSPVTADTTQLLDLDKKIDDGNLTTGLFFVPSSSYAVYVVEK